MSTYSRLVYPFFARLDAEEAHERILGTLEWAQANALGRATIRAVAGSIPNQPVELFGLTFPNVLGMAAGFDKDVRVAAGLAQLGFGHIEVGTLTPRPQVGNPRPRIFRLREDQAVVNRMGFPNGGVEAALPRLKALAESDHPFIVGVSLGKQKETPLTDAVDDYLTVMQAVFPYADYLAVNISSPNTPGLRELQGGDYLGRLLSQLMEQNWALAERHSVPKRPLLVKIAPDLSPGELDEILDTVMAAHIDGIIATNTTLGRDNLVSPQQTEQGGLSGAPLAYRSTEIIAAIARRTEGKLPIIGVGGVVSAEDVRAKLDAGASLVQLYTSMVYEGPGLPGRLLRALAQSDASDE